MKAVLCKEFGPVEQLVVEEVPSLKAGPGQVVISVKACGINFPDGLIVQGKYQTKPPLPFSPGLEVAGVIKALGEGVTDLKVGQRVIGFPGVGGLAEEVALDAWLCFPMPDSMSYADGAGFLITYATSHHALKPRGHLKAGETLLVLGAAGGVGLTAVEIGKVMGAKVIAAASSDEKLALAREYGADEVINYATENLRDRIKAITGGKGVDVVYDPVGGEIFETSLRCVAWGARLLVIGFAAGQIQKIPANILLVKNIDAQGFYWGSYRRHRPDMVAQGLAELSNFHAAGLLQPHISHRFDLADFAPAFELLTTRKSTGKIVLTP